MNEAPKKKKRTIYWIGTGLMVLFFAVNVFFRFDFESGSHRIMPTAVDKDYWGNYKVYFRTSEFTQNNAESIYYILGDREELVEQINDAIFTGATVMVYYDEWVGYKGIGAPHSSPIVRVEVIPN